MLQSGDHDLHVTRLGVLTPDRLTFMVVTYWLVIDQHHDLRWRAMSRTEPMDGATFMARYGGYDRKEISEAPLGDIHVGHYRNGKLKLNITLPLGERFWYSLGAATGDDPVRLKLQT